MKILSMLCTTALLCGCAVTLPTRQTADASAPDVSPVQVSPAYRTAPLALSKLPPDSALAMAGIVQLIRGERPTIDHLTIAPGINITEPGAPLESFRFIDLTILDRAEREVVKGQTWETKTMAVLTFGLGPWRALVLTEAVTTTSSSGVVLTRASARSLSPAQPRTVAWFVPKAAFQAATAADKAMPVWDLMDVANSMGVPVGAGHPPTKEPQLAVVFVLDRLEPGDTVKARMSDNPTPPSMLLTATPARHGVGFPVAMVNVNDPLNVATAERFVHVAWRPHDTSRTNGHSMDIPIGRFSTAKAFSDGASATIAGATGSPKSGATTSPKIAPSGGLLSSSPRLLDFRVKNDALLIQGQLKKMGYYFDNVDGDFGKGSQAALAKFKKSKGMAEGTTWDQATQAALFGTSGP